LFPTGELLSVDTVEQIFRRLGGIGGLAMVAIIILSVLRARPRLGGVVVGVSPRPLYSPLFLIAACAGLAAVGYLLWSPIIPEVPLPWRIILLLLGSGLYFCGLFFILWGRFTLGRMHNVSSGRGVELFTDHELVTHGAFAVVRHPMYFGFFLLLGGGLLLYRTWAFVLFALGVLVFIRRARLEEQALANAFGERWNEYAARVPMFFPWRH
jgi:protein-S-isoprenylcysteine O-methyltransferase Ste14